MRRSDSIRNSPAPVPKSQITAPQNREYGLNGARTSRWTAAAGNGIFGCRDQAPRVVIQTRQRRQRPKSGKRVARNPRRNALFGVVSEKCGLRRLDGGVCSQIRTGLRRQNPNNREKYSSCLPSIKKGREKMNQWEEEDRRRQGEMFTLIYDIWTISISGRRAGPTFRHCMETMVGQPNSRRRHPAGFGGSECRRPYRWIETPVWKKRRRGVRQATRQYQV